MTPANGQVNGLEHCMASNQGEDKDDGNASQEALQILKLRIACLLLIPA